MNPQCHLFLWLKLVNGGCISFGQQQMLQLAISPTCPDWRPVGWSRLFGLLQAIHQPSVATGGFKRCWQLASPRPRLHHVLKQTGHVATCKFSPGRNSPKNRAFDAGGLRHCQPVFFSHPNMGSRNSPSAVTLKKRRHRKFHRVLALIPVVSNLLYKSNASGSQHRFLTTLPREEAFHPSHLFRHHLPLVQQ